MAEGNSFTNLLKMMKDEGYNKDASMVIAKVKSISPLTINMGKYDITKGDFFMAQHLTTYTRNVSLSTSSVSGKTSVTHDGGEKAKSHSHNVLPFTVNSGVLTLHSPLAVGDKVFVLIDGDDFYIIDKVVT